MRWAIPKGAALNLLKELLRLERLQVDALAAQVLQQAPHLLCTALPLKGVLATLMLAQRVFLQLQEGVSSLCCKGVLAGYMPLLTDLCIYHSILHALHWPSNLYLPASCRLSRYFCRAPGSIRRCMSSFCLQMSSNERQYSDNASPDSHLPLTIQYASGHVHEALHTQSAGQSVGPRLNVCLRTAGLLTHAHICADQT